jgi:hypothetical protein
MSLVGAAAPAPNETFHADCAYAGAQTPINIVTNAPKVRFIAGLLFGALTPKHNTLSKAGLSAYPEETVFFVRKSWSVDPAS